MKSTLFVEYKGSQTDTKDFSAKAKEAWTGAGNKIKDIKELNLYVKPEENACYYVINNDFSGSITLN